MRTSLVLALAMFACGGKEEPAKQAPPPKVDGVPKADGVPTADGVRMIQIEATKDGYAPDKIPGKPGEKLKLVFTRRASGGECLAELKSPDGKLHQLPLDKPYEIAVTVPNDGEVRFACGMDMFTGSIVAKKS